MAAQQIRNHFKFIRDNYHYFRKEIHSIRRTVEGGVQQYSSLLGPNGFLHVDPEKDIDIRGVVIGGRTKDDYQESDQRNQLELEYSRVLFESWDSWLRKYHWF